MKAVSTIAQPKRAVARVSRRSVVANDFRRNKYIYAMLVPVLLYYLVFHYVPMYGAQIAFKDYIPSRGIWNSPWIGWENFEDFFNGLYFWRLVRNTLAINLLDVIFGFPAPIILALLLNELTSERFKRTVQTITYMPHFISLVVVVGMVIDFLARDGLINQFLMMMGFPSIPFMQRPEYYWGIYVASDIWQGIGWGSIIYLAAIASINPTLYEAAKVDGASRFRQIWHVTLPGILPTIIILLILRLGTMMTLGYEKAILLYNPLLYERADVISTYVYRQGILDANFSFSAAIGLFNSVINFALLIAANYLSRRYSENSLW
jgi:putative aldouronate transport system permease protein